MTSSESADEVAVLEDDILAGPILEIGARFASAFIIWREKDYGVAGIGMGLELLDDGTPLGSTARAG